MWFKNVMIYRLTSELTLESESLEAQLQACRFHPCSQHDMSQFGWSEPLSGAPLLHFAQGKQFLLVAHKEEKLLPANVVKKEARMLKKTEKQAVKDQVVSVLLPRAFSKHQFTAIWIDLDTQLVYVDAASSKRAEDALALLRKTLGSLPVVPISFTVPPIEVMTRWIAQDDAPNWLTLLEEAELKAFDTDSIIRCKRQDLSAEEISQHLQAGKFVTKLAIEWENHFSCILNEDATLSRLKFADVVREKNDDILKEDVAQRLDADFLLMTAELQQFSEKLIEAFGGMQARI